MTVGLKRTRCKGNKLITVVIGKKEINKSRWKSKRKHKNKKKGTLKRWWKKSGMHSGKWGPRTSEHEIKAKRQKSEAYKLYVQSRWSGLSHDTSHRDWLQHFTALFHHIFLPLSLPMSHPVLLPSPVPAPTVPQHCSEKKKKKKRMDHLTFSGRQEEKPSQNLKLPKNTGERRGEVTWGREGGDGWAGGGWRREAANGIFDIDHNPLTRNNFQRTELHADIL